MKLRERPWRERARLNLLYFLELLRSFVPALLALGLFFVVGTLLIRSLYPAGGEPTLLKSCYYMFFLLLAEPTFEQAPKHWAVDLVAVLSPLVGIVVVFDLLARFNVHVFTKKRHRREWVNVVAKTLENHIVLVGLGKVGRKVLEELVNQGESVICIEMDEEAPGVRIARQNGIAVLIDDARDDRVLRDAGVDRARAVLAVTDDDMVNVEVLLDSRRLSETVRLIGRMFEEDLGGKINKAFKLDGVYSTSSLAAPLFAIASIDEEIVNSYYVDGERFVVVETSVQDESWLAGQSVAEARDSYGLVVLQIGGKAGLRSDAELKPGLAVTFQCPLETFRKYRRANPVCSPR